MRYIESIVTNVKVRNGLKILNEAAHKQEEMKAKGVFFDIYAISDVWQPIPALWRATQLDDDPEFASISFIHNGDEFIWVEADGVRFAIRWTSIDSYRLA